MQVKRNLINIYIEKNSVLSFITHSELVKLPIFLLIECFMLFMPLMFYRNQILKVYIPKMKTIEMMDKRGILLFFTAVFSMIAYIIISYSFVNQLTFPLFELKDLFYWLRIIIITCFLVPFGEELFFRGIVLNEIKYCYKFSSRLTIFSQAFIFLFFHILFSSDIQLSIIWIGIITGIFAFYTDSLLYGILYHTCYNLFILLAQTGLVNFAKFKISHFILIPLLILIVVLNILFIILFIKHMKTRPISVKDTMTSCNTTSKPV
jgi:membrane protease YdiL (CAAX protease family)